MTTQPNKRKRGRPPTGKPQAKRIGFYVSEADHTWLTALTNRSAWLAENVRQDSANEKRIATLEAEREALMTGLGLDPETPGAHTLSEMRTAGAGALMRIEHLETEGERASALLRAVENIEQWLLQSSMRSLLVRKETIGEAGQGSVSDDSGDLVNVLIALISEARDEPLQAGTLSGTVSQSSPGESASTEAEGKR